MPARVVIATLGALLLVAVLYAVGINVFFSTPLFERVVNAKPLTIDVHYRRGWSIVPGRIHAKDLSIRGRDTNVEWILRIDDVTFDVSFRGLLRQRFEASRIHGKGVSFRLRSRIDSQTITPASVADLPPIDGLRSVPVRPFRQCSIDEWSDADYHLWTVQLANVVAEGVREVWIDHERWDGEATVTGGFYLKPIRSARVGPVHADFREGGFERGGTSQVEALSGVSEVTVAPFDPRVTDAEALLHRVSVGLDVRARVPDVAQLPIRLPEQMKLHGAVDVRRLTLRVRSGIVMDDSHLDARAPSVTLSWETQRGAGQRGRGKEQGGRHEMTGEVSLAAEVSLTDQGKRMSMLAHLSDLRVDGPILRARRVEVEGWGGALDVARPFADLRLAVRSDSIELPEASALSRYMPASSPLAIRGGSARASFSADLAVAAGIDHLALDLQARRLGLGYRDADVVGDARAHIRVRDWRWSSRELTLDQAAFDLLGASVWMRGRASGQPTLSVRRLSIGAQSARLELSNPRSRLKLSAQLFDARLHGPSLRGRVDALASLDLSDSSRPARGIVQVDLSQAAGTLGQARLAGRARVVVRVGGLAGEPGAFDLSQSFLEMRDVGVASQLTRTLGWNANAVLSRATLYLGGGPPRFEGHISLQATDADPLLAVLVHNRLPQLLGLTHQPHLLASARLSLGGRRLALENVQVRAGDVTVRGLYGVRDSLRRGAMIVARGPFSVGLRLDNGGAHLRLFGLQGWSRREEMRVQELLWP